MAELGEAHKLLIQTYKDLSLKFDAIPIYGKDNNPKSYLGMVTLEGSLNETTAYAYRVFQGVENQSQQAITQGTLTDTNNRAFVFSISDDFEVDYFVQVIILDDRPLNDNTFIDAFVPLPLVCQKQQGAKEIFGIFYTKKVLKERREKINQAKTAAKEKKKPRKEFHLNNEELKELWARDDWCGDTKLCEEAIGSDWLKNKTFKPYTEEWYGLNKANVEEAAGTDYCDWLNNKAFKPYPLEDDDEIIPREMFQWGNIEIETSH